MRPSAMIAALLAVPASAQFFIPTPDVGEGAYAAAPFGAAEAMVVRAITRWGCVLPEEVLLAMHGRGETAVDSEDLEAAVGHLVRVGDAERFEGQIRLLKGACA